MTMQSGQPVSMVTKMLAAPSTEDPESAAAAQSPAVAIPTLGEIFADGTVIELLGRGQLICYQAGTAVMQPAIEYGGQHYVAATLGKNLEQALALPAQAEDYVSTEHLLEEMKTLIANFTDLPEGDALLLATFFLCTWLPESLPTIPILNVNTPLGGDCIISDLASVFCRRAIRLIQPSVEELRALPTGLFPTLLLRDPPRRSLNRILQITSERYPALLSGKLVSMPAPSIILTEEPIEAAAPVLRLQLPPSSASYRRILPDEAGVLAQRFQPRLLDFRLKQHRRIANSQIDCPGFNPETRVLARMLGACVEGADVLQRQLVEALKLQNEERKIELSQQLAAFVIEGLLVAIHENRSRITTGEVAELAEKISLGRGQDSKLGARKVGNILRALGIHAQRQGPGYTVTLTAALGCQIHDLAHAYGVLTLLTPEPLCQCCHQTRTQVEVFENAATANHVHNVHNVHHVHELGGEGGSEIYDRPPAKVDNRSSDPLEGPR